MRPSPPLQHLLQQVLLLGRLLGRHVLITHVAQLAGRVGLHGLAPLALLTRTGEDAGFLGRRWGSKSLQGPRRWCGHADTGASLAVVGETVLLMEVCKVLEGAGQSDLNMTLRPHMGRSLYHHTTPRDPAQPKCVT